MSVKDILYDEDFSDVYKVFLYYNIAHIPTTITSVRKGAYKESDLKFDCKQNLLLKFPEMKDYEFEEIWKNILNKFSRSNINHFEEMDQQQAEFLFKIANNQIYNFVLEKIHDLNEDQLNILYEFLRNSPDNTKEFNMSYSDENGDFFISLGLLYKGSYYDSNGNLTNANYYYYPWYFSDLKYKILKHIGDRKNFSEEHKIIKAKRKKIKKKLVKKDKKEKIFKLKVILKGKKGKKKIKVEITGFGIGAEFSGQEQKTIEIKCGNCGKSDKFIIENEEEKLLRCGKCMELNKPVGKDNFYFE